MSAMPLQIIKRLMRAKSAFIAVIAIIILVFAALNGYSDSGSYKTSKHGNSQIGVNRDSNSARGSCAQCHLEHDGDMPFDFALFTNDDNTLCQTTGCHDFAYQWPSGDYYWPYPGNVPDWYNSGHGRSAASFPPGSQRTVSLCVQCHNPHSAADSTAGTIPSSLSRLEEKGCFSNDGTSGNGCHGNNSGNRPYGALDIYTQMLKTSRHNVFAQSKKHSSDWLPGYPYGRESRVINSGFFSGTNRHVECVDCHNPHKSIAGNHTPGSNNIGGSLLGSWGVSPINGGAWTIPSVFSATDFTSTAQSKEFQLCFKCHSYYAFGNTSPSGYTDIAREFNPANSSYHPIEDYIRTNSYTSPSVNNGQRETMEAPWDNGIHDLMTCSDCHSSETSTDPAGPHGSNQPYLLIASPSATDRTFCTKCHKASVYAPTIRPGTNVDTGSRFDEQTTRDGDASHWFHVTAEGYSCRQCHGSRQTPPPSSPERRTPYPIEVGSSHGSNTFSGLVNGTNIYRYTPGRCWPTCHEEQTYTAGPE